MKVLDFKSAIGASIVFIVPVGFVGAYIYVMDRGEEKAHRPAIDKIVVVVNPIPRERVKAIGLIAY